MQNLLVRYLPGGALDTSFGPSGTGATVVQLGSSPPAPGVTSSDELLARVDAEASRRALSRSAMLRQFASAALDDDARTLAARMREIGQQTSHHGGTGLELLKALRPP